MRWQPPPQQPLPPPDLSGPLRVIQIPGHAPEDVVIDAGGAIWTGTDDGAVVRIAPGTAPEVVANTGGRPLGLAVARDGRVLICDSHRGLLRLDPASGTFETLVREVAGRPLTFCSNVVESSDGTIFFTESTSRFHYEYYKGSVLEARASGSLFRLDLDGTVTTLATGLRFANGVALSADESTLVVAETTACRVSKYPLTGSGVGEPVPLIEHLPGYPDNISTAPDGSIWVALVSERNAVGEWLAPRAPVLRRLLWQLPYRWLPNPKPLVWAIAVDLDGRPRAQLRTTDPQFALATGLVEHDGTLWLGCIGSSAVACLDL
ncbi:SMP-30/gluconolactonase/LRE family protein [Mycobacterium sp. CVI_P3]|uniref:SMP-30/gluconolactonase/LRE family protein n=1 Tax=Mycobacterium pinniadriaticum TaxID=2994102 RepID=A0ABT3SQ30_9MYCO|nr:SMP-30/gluconolactonase/LRE family protein [Mycobacterium pinniadriaticum]MCX2934870.1 SMP-30/gluconolactonase/LRE family protein [Mycobacterium pinniadriaticum]MCX2941289.1 SMP-30/gluconolactonase/LRE family protein [Mycobacterium pinniadriaticum]